MNCDGIYKTAVLKSNRQTHRDFVRGKIALKNKQNTKNMWQVTNNITAPIAWALIYCCSKSHHFNCFGFFSRERIISIYFSTSNQLSVEKKCGTIWIEKKQRQQITCMYNQAVSALDIHWNALSTLKYCWNAIWAALKKMKKIDMKIHRASA